LEIFTAGVLQSRLVTKDPLIDVDRCGKVLKLSIDFREGTMVHSRLLSLGVTLALAAVVTFAAHAAAQKAAQNSQTDAGGAAPRFHASTASDGG
jgi:hypothetical protein